MRALRVQGRAVYAAFGGIGDHALAKADCNHFRAVLRGLVWSGGSADNLLPSGCAKGRGIRHGAICDHGSKIVGLTMLAFRFAQNGSFGTAADW